MQRCGREMLSAGGVVSGWSRSAAEGDLHGDVYNKDYEAQELCPGCN